jgi:hypothetical protein
MKKNGIDTDYRPSQDQKQSNAIINGRNNDQMDSGGGLTATRISKKYWPRQRHTRGGAAFVRPWLHDKKTRKPLHSGEGQTCGIHRVSGNTVL